MLEASAQDGRARLCAWTPGAAAVASAAVTTPALVVPEVSLTAVPDWAQVVLSAQPRPPVGGRIHLLSGGTWFRPNPAARGADAADRTDGTRTDAAAGSDGADAGSPLVVPPVPPAPTSEVQVVPVGEDLAVWHDAGAWCEDPSGAVLALIEARGKAGPARLLWAPMLGDPAEYALWVHLGIDLFDAAPLLLAATRGQALTTDGPLSAAAMADLHGGTWDAARLAAFNLEAARAELALVRQKVREGTLRALVERRVYARPHSVEVLRRFDREHAFLEAAAPSHRTVPLPCMTAESLWGPEVERFRRRLRERYVPPAGADVLVLLPCSARKPYKTSKSHRYMQRALDLSGARGRCHEVMVTSPLGVVPRELEEVYPACAYDVPVTGRWMRDEEEIIRTQLAALLEKGQYRHVVAHVGASTLAFLRDLLPADTIVTGEQRPASIEECARLTEALRPFAGPAPAGRKTMDLHALASFQFGPAAAQALLRDARAHGRMPFVKLDGPEGQLGTTTPERGVLSLTLEGARRIAPFAGPRVRIGDFHPRGTSTLFAVGVEGADAEVRPGDEVVVVHGDDVRAVGVAQMSAEQMADWRRGPAVALRHTAKAAKAAKAAPAGNAGTPGGAVEVRA